MHIDTLDLKQITSSALKLNPWLKTLNLNNNNLTHNNIKELTTALTENKALETLLISNNIEIGDLRDNNITNLGVESLKSIPGNMMILVDGNDIDNSIFEKSVEALGENN